MFDVIKSLKRQTLVHSALGSYIDLHMQKMLDDWCLGYSIRYIKERNIVCLHYLTDLFVYRISFLQLSDSTLSTDTVHYVLNLIARAV